MSEAYPLDFFRNALRKLDLVSSGTILFDQEVIDLLFGIFNYPDRTRGPDVDRFIRQAASSLLRGWIVKSVTPPRDPVSVQLELQGALSALGGGKRKAAARKLASSNLSEFYKFWGGAILNSLAAGKRRNAAPEWYWLDKAPFAVIGSVLLPVPERRSIMTSLKMILEGREGWGRILDGKDFSGTPLEGKTPSFDGLFLLASAAVDRAPERRCSGPEGPERSGVKRGAPEGPTGSEPERKRPAGPVGPWVDCDDPDTVHIPV